MPQDLSNNGRKPQKGHRVNIGGLIDAAKRIAGRPVGFSPLTSAGDQRILI